MSLVEHHRERLATHPQRQDFIVDRADIEALLAVTEAAQHCLTCIDEFHDVDPVNACAEWLQSLDDALDRLQAATQPAEAEARADEEKPLSREELGVALAATTRRALEWEYEYGNLNKQLTALAAEKALNDHARGGNVSDLATRMRALADEIADPLVCRSPAYGVPGKAHCAACCYETGFVVTCVEDEVMLEAARALRRAARLLSLAAAQPAETQ